MDKKRILSLAVALVSAGVFAVYRRFLEADPMETFVPALSGLGFTLLGLAVFEIFFSHLVPTAWAFLTGVCLFGWGMILWPRFWDEAWIAAGLLSLLVLGRVLLRSKRSYDRAVARRLFVGQAAGLAAVLAAVLAGSMLPVPLNLFSPVVLVFPAFFLWGLWDAGRRRSQSYIVQSAKRSTFESLVAGLAHELNNPLNFIYANIEPLREAVQKLRQGEGTEHGEIDRILDTMEEGVNRARGLIERFREFPSGGEEPKEEVDLNRILDGTIEMLSPKWKDRLTVERRFGDLPPLAGYPLQLGQIFTNLIANACDAAPDGGLVTVTTSLGATGAKISVKDNGPGIPRDRIARIFDPFYTTKEQGQGTGLGLALALQLVKNHKGSVEVKSEAGKGAEFLVSLPYA